MKKVLVLLLDTSCLESAACLADRTGALAANLDTEQLMSKRYFLSMGLSKRNQSGTVNHLSLVIKVFAITFLLVKLLTIEHSIMMTTTSNMMYKYSSGDDSSSHGSKRYAVANYVESPDQLYGVYGIHKQLLKYNMTCHKFNSNISTTINTGGGEVDHVVVVPNTIESKYHQAIVEWVGESNVYKVNRTYIINRLSDEQNMWKGTFNKLWLFNLTMYDKVIVLDGDVLIRTNIMHWFEVRI